MGIKERKEREKLQRANDILEAARQSADNCALGFDFCVEILRFVRITRTTNETEGPYDKDTHDEFNEILFLHRIPMIPASSSSRKIEPNPKEPVS